MGIAIGAGTDVAMETLDIVLVNSDPRDVLQIVSLAQNIHNKMEQHLCWASGYNIIGIPLAAGVAAPLGVILPPAEGAIVMTVSTVIVAINSRLLTAPESESKDEAQPREKKESSKNKKSPNMHTPDTRTKRQQVYLNEDPSI